VAWLLEQARRASFEGDNEEALEFVRQASEVLPEEPAVLNWNRKLLDNLGRQWASVANDWNSENNLEAARDAALRSLQYVPESPETRALLARVLAQLNYREEVSEEYYRDGVLLLSDYLLEQARTGFEKSQFYDARNALAGERKEDVEIFLAELVVAKAGGLESDGLYAAARNEYRIAMLYDENNQDAKDGLERTLQESTASELLHEAEMLLLRSRFDEASEAVDRAEALSSHQDELITTMRDRITEARYERMFGRALALEKDLRYEEAVVAYDELIAAAGYFENAIARRDTLVEFIDKAAELYEKARKAEEPANRVRYLRAIETFWPGYRDIDAQLERLDPSGRGR
jgi:tetratricopeptide (TPR) repeat protein